jgi:hypothetical protein
LEQGNPLTVADALELGMLEEAVGGVHGVQGAIG